MIWIYRIRYATNIHIHSLCTQHNWYWYTIEFYYKLLNTSKLHTAHMIHPPSGLKIKTHQEKNREKEKQTMCKRIQYGQFIVYFTFCLCFYFFLFVFVFRRTIHERNIPRISNRCKPKWRHTMKWKNKQTRIYGYFESSRVERCSRIRLRCILLCVFFFFCSAALFSVSNGKHVWRKKNMIASYNSIVNLYISFYIRAQWQFSFCFVF